MANSNIDITSPHYKGEFSSIYEVNRKFPTGGVAGDFVVIEGWAHYWNADRATWCVNAERDSYWDELVTNILEKFKLFRGATYMGVAGLDTVPEKATGVKMYYFAIVPGTYTNFGNLVVPQGINVLYSEEGKSWACSSLLEVAQEVGESEWKVVSQNLLKKTQNLINAELAKKANAADVASKFTAEAARVNAELGKKANAEDVEQSFSEQTAKNTEQDIEIAKKANTEYVASKFNEESSRVNAELAKKANAEEVASKFTEEATRVDAELAKKANAKDVEQSFSEQDAKNTEQDAEIAKKANAADVATKADVAKTNAEQDKEISRKANQQDVERSLNILRKEIGERTVVEGDVNNNPDEEDLTSKMGSNNRAVLSLKDREYNPLEFSGKGYKILRKNMQEVTCAITKIQVTKAPTTDGYVSIIINGVETHVDLVASTDNTVALVAKKIADKLSETMDEYVTSIDGALVTCTRSFGGDVTSSSFSGVNTGSEATVGESSKTEIRNLITAAMLSEANTIYEIRYDFNLNGETIELHDGATLKFDGGKINNGILIGNDTIIKAGKCSIFNNVSIKGSWKCSEIYSTFFEDIENVNKLVDLFALCSNAIHNNVFLDDKYYILTKDAATNDTNDFIFIKSYTYCQLNGTIQLKNTNSKIYRLFNIDSKNNIEFEGNGSIIGDRDFNLISSGEWGMGFYLKDCNNITIKGLKISNFFGDSIYVGNYCKNILIKGNEIFNSRRQGVSVIGGDTIFIIGNYIHDINGTSPECAIDIEPNRDNTVDNVYIQNNIFKNNKGGSILTTFGSDFEKSYIRNVFISNNVFSESGKRDLFFNRGENIFVTYNNIKGTILGGVPKIIISNNNIETDSIVLNECHYSCISNNNILLVKDGITLTGKGFRVSNNNIELKNETNNFIVIDLKLAESSFVTNNIIKGVSSNYIIRNNITDNKIPNCIIGNYIDKENPKQIWSTKSCHVEAYDLMNVGVNDEIPKIKENSLIYNNSYIGYKFFNKTTNKPIYWNGEAWCDSNGISIDTKLSGATSERPTKIPIGFIYKDTTIGKLIVWDGSSWINMDGSKLS